MYNEHPCFDKPLNKNIKIWRFLDFTKFVALLSKKTLFCSWASKLPDPFEGKYTKSVYKKIKKAIESLNIKKGDLEVIKNIDNIRNFIGINSWHMNDFESAAMWKLYLKSDEGIAIQSTFNRLKNSFHNTKDDIYIGKVKYIDYEKEYFPENNIYYAYLHKRKSFKHEQELRAIVTKLPYTKNGSKVDFKKQPVSNGIYISVDLDMLIDKVVVAPTSEKWFKELVESVVKKYNLNKEVVVSSLAERPLY